MRRMGSSFAMLCWAAALLLLGCAGPRAQRLATGPGLDNADPAAAERGVRFADLSTDALVRLGEENASRGNLSVAKLHFAAAADKDPRSLAALVGLGDVLLREGRHGEARALFQRALAEDPSSVPALFGLGKANWRSGNHEEAIEQLETAAERAPERVDMLEELALAHEAAGRQDLALALFRQAAETAGSARALNHLGYSYVLQGLHSEAVPVLERAVQLDPAHRRIRNNLALAYAMTGREQEAFRLFESTVGPAGAYNNLGYVHMVRGNWREAEEALRKAIEVRPTFYVRAKENLDQLGQAVYAKAKANLEDLKERDNPEQ